MPLISLPVLTNGVFTERLQACTDTWYDKVDWESSMAEARLDRDQTQGMAQSNHRRAEWQRPALTRLAARAAENLKDDNLHDKGTSFS
jgi:hypothetical protein